MLLQGKQCTQCRVCQPRLAHIDTEARTSAYKYKSLCMKTLRVNSSCKFRTFCFWKAMTTTLQNRQVYGAKVSPGLRHAAAPPLQPSPAAAGHARLPACCCGPNLAWEWRDEIFWSWLRATCLKHWPQELRVLCLSLATNSFFRTFWKYLEPSRGWGPGTYGLEVVEFPR